MPGEALPQQLQGGKGHLREGLGVASFTARMSAIKQHFSADLGRRNTEVFARQEGYGCKKTL